MKRKEPRRRKTPKKAEPRVLRKTSESFAGEFVGDPFVMKRYAISRVTVWSWTRRGILPAPVRIGPNTKRWRLADLVAWEASRAATTTPPSAQPA